MRRGRKPYSFIFLFVAFSIMHYDSVDWTEMKGKRMNLFLWGKLSFCQFSGPVLS